MKKLGSDSDITLDTLFGGELICRQNQSGYRFSMDAVLLAHFSKLSGSPRILDLGAGNGIISLILAYRWRNAVITAVELQPGLFELLRMNVEANNGLSDRITCLQGDLQDYAQLLHAEEYDWAFCNPPYRKSGSGRINPKEEEAIARHELRLDLSSVVAAQSYCLKAKGRAVLVYPAGRMAVLIGELKATGLEPKRLQVVYSYPGGQAKLVLVEAIKKGGEELTILPPFYVYKYRNGPYSDEMQRLY